MKKIVIWSIILPIILFAFDYPSQWQIVTKFDTQKLPQSALEKVEEIYEASKEEGNSTQFIRATLYKKKYASKLYENGEVIAIQVVEKAITEAKKSEDKLLLTSILAQMYKEYYNQHRYQIQKRSMTTASTKKTILTWSSKDFLTKIYYLYQKSLNNITQNIPIAQYQDILTEAKNVEGLRPTLYDLLVFRALNYFQNEASYLHQVTESFSFQNQDAFSSAFTFSQLTLDSKESNSFKYQTALLYQNLLKFYFDNNHQKALDHVNIERLKFVRKNFHGKDKERLYMEALNRSLEKNPNSEALIELISYAQTKKENKKALKLIKKALLSTNKFVRQAAIQNKHIIEREDLNIQLEEVILPKENILTKVSYKNIKRLYVKVLKLSKKEKEKLFKIPYNLRVDYLKNLKSFKNFSFKLPKTDDYKTHSTELSLKNYALGEYYFLFSSSQDFHKNQFFKRVTISNLAFLQQKSKKIMVVNRKSGKPLKGVHVLLYNNQTLEHDKVTNSKGEVHFSELEKHYRIRLEYKNDILDLNNRIYRNHPYSNDKKEIRRVHFFTDRAIYRPGQSIYFKALATKQFTGKRPKILTNEKISVIFKNTNGQAIKKETFTSDEFGSFQGHFTAPSSGLLGSMSLSSSLSGSTYFSVEEYKRPKFEVTILPTQQEYELDDNVNVQGHIKAFVGNAISNAQVHYRVERKSDFFWSDKFISPHANAKELTSGITRSDQEGKFSIDFLAEKSLSSINNQHPSYSYIVHVDVTDTTGETHSTEHTFHIGHVNFTIDMQLKKDIDIDEKNILVLESKNLDGDFIPVKGSIDIEKLEVNSRLYRKRYWAMSDKKAYSKEAFKNYFPAYKYDEKEELPKHLIETLYFDTAKTKKLSLNHLTEGKYLLTLRTYDRNGELLMKTKEFLLSRATHQGLIEPTYLWHQHKEKAYKVGESAVINIKSSLNQAEVLLTIVQNSKVIKEKWIRLNSFHQEVLKMKASYKGDINYYLIMIHNNRQFSQHGRISVPWDNKLKVEYLSFRDKLKPNKQEHIHLKISGEGKEKVLAQMVATIYDASLDGLYEHRFLPLLLFPSSPPSTSFWHATNFYARRLGNSWIEKDPLHQKRQFSTIKWLNNYNQQILYRESENYAMVAPVASPMMETEAGGDIYPYEDSGMGGVETKKYKTQNSKTLKTVYARKNLQETMFFKPDIKTDKEGNIFIDFKTNDALTRWNFMAFIHTKDLKTAITKKSFTTAKELMVVTNLPRFFREKDHIILSAKVVNISKKDLNGTCELQMVDPVTEKPIFNREFKKEIFVKKGASTVVEFKFTVPNVDKVSAIKHTIIAKTATHSDAEQIIRPILSNRMFVTESKNMFVKAKEQKSFTLESLQNSQSNTLSNHKLTLEFSSNPAWYAIKSLPYLMEYPHECNEQLFNRYFANALAAKIANSSPKVKEVFEQWKNKAELLSALETNQELKSILLEETPWVLNAKSESEQQANLGLLFDLTRLAKEEESTYNKLVKRQFEHSDGGWAWFKSPRSNWYITQYIVEGFGKLKNLGIDKTNTEAMATAIHYMDLQMLNEYNKLLKNIKEHGVSLEDDHLSPLLVHYLYARSFYSFKMHTKVQKAHDYYLEQSKKYWGAKGLYEQGMIALTLNATQDNTTALAIVKSLKERALVSDELGMYFKYDNGYTWNQMPIETHALMIDVFSTISNDTASVNLLKTWLLKNKQTNHWKTTKATASAIYALLSNEKWLDNDKQVELNFETTLPYQDALQKAEVQAGTGYIKASFNNFDQSMATVHVNNPNDHVAWGALYWQYFEEMDKVKNFKETPLKLKKKLFLVKQTPQGEILSPIENQILKVGDKVKVRIELSVDRNMEYIMLKDARASAFEPVNVLSQYKYQDGLGYYESTKDNATYFFMDFLHKGTYVFEYPLFVTHKGDFSNGITSIESMYAPEFKSHSEGVRVLVQ